jgi:ATP-dependent protease ClpP protease subunit
MTQAQQPKWYEIKAAARSADGAPKAAEISIYGNIGDRWNEDGVIASDMVREISALDADTITLRINSYGGSVTDGLAIYNALKRHPATVDVQVDGVAISCASYIAMAGDTITMAENAQMMVHAPWGWATGNAVELREQADVLDRYAKAMAGAYADKSGMTFDEALAILSDGKDHWYSAQEAVDAGFADVVGTPVAVAASLAKSFDLSRFQRAAAPQASGSAPATSAATEPTVSQPPADAGINPGASMPNTVTAAAQPAAPQAFVRTREQNQEIVAIFAPFASQPGISALQTEMLADTSLTVDQVQARLLTELGKGASPATPKGAGSVIQTVEDETDKQRDAAVNALLVRSGVQVDASVRASMSANPFRGHKLLDLARASLARTNVRTDGMSQMEIVASAFTQGTSDFPVLLENTMKKALQAGYALAPLTWNRFCATGTVGDFRDHNRYRLGSFGSLDAKNELGEFTNKTIPDGEKASVRAGTKGNIINLSREAIVNDDLGAFVGLADMLGRAAARTVEVDVYALLGLNGGLGPVMADGKTLFHADHGNVGAGAAISMSSIDADRVLMASQMDISRNDYLDLRPSVLVLPIGLGGTARSINQAQYDPDTANKLQKPNVVNGLYADIVDTPRLLGTRRYSFADPTVAPVLEVVFLDGNQTPFLEMKDGFDVDGARWKVRLDYGVAAVDFRGAVTNAGQ